MSGKRKSVDSVLFAKSVPKLKKLAPHAHMELISADITPHLDLANDSLCATLLRLSVELPFAEQVNFVAFDDIRECATILTVGTVGDVRNRVELKEHAYSLILQALPTPPKYLLEPQLPLGWQTILPKIRNYEPIQTLQIGSPVLL